MAGGQFTIVVYVPTLFWQFAFAYVPPPNYRDIISAPGRTNDLGYE